MAETGLRRRAERWSSLMHGKSTVIRRVRWTVVAIAIIGCFVYGRFSRSGQDAKQRPISVQALQSLREGMSYEDAVRALSSSGRKLDDRRTSGPNVIIYEWDLDDGSKQRVAFIDGHLKYLSRR